MIYPKSNLSDIVEFESLDPTSFNLTRNTIKILDYEYLKYLFNESKLRSSSYIQDVSTIFWNKNKEVVEFKTITKGDIDNSIYGPTHIYNGILDRCRVGAHTTDTLPPEIKDVYEELGTINFVIDKNNIITIPNPPEVKTYSLYHSALEFKNKNIFSKAQNKPIKTLSMTGAYPFYLLDNTGVSKKVLDYVEYKDESFLGDVNSFNNILIGCIHRHDNQYIPGALLNGTATHLSHYKSYNSRSQYWVWSHTTDKNLAKGTKLLEFGIRKRLDVLYDLHRQRYGPSDTLLKKINEELGTTYPIANIYNAVSEYLAHITNVLVPIKHRVLDNMSKPMLLELEYILSKVFLIGVKTNLKYDLLTIFVDLSKLDSPEMICIRRILRKKRNIRSNVYSDIPLDDIHYSRVPSKAKQASELVRLLSVWARKFNIQSDKLKYFEVVINFSKLSEIDIVKKVLNHPKADEYK